MHTYNDTTRIPTGGKFGEDAPVVDIILPSTHCKKRTRINILKDNLLLAKFATQRTLDLPHTPKLCYCMRVDIFCYTNDRSNAS